MARSSATLGVAVLLAALAPSISEGAQGVVHKVSSARESYAEIAQHYYGVRALGHHLRVVNRVPEPLTYGRTLVIPTCRSVALKKGQTLEAFAKANLGDPARAEYLEVLHFLVRKGRS